MLRKGVWLGLDRTVRPGSSSRPNRPGWEERTRTIQRLIEAGFGHKICLGHDWMTYAGIMSEQDFAKRRAANPDGYCFIQKAVLPKLHELGVTKEQTDRIMFDNPRRFFENRP